MIIFASGTNVATTEDAMEEKKTITIGMSGANGFVGSHLAAWFEAEGYTILRLSYKALNSSDITPLQHEVAQCDIIINLAGATLTKRWSKSYRKRLYDSRLIPTRNIVKAINSTQRVKLFISTSAVGIYPSDSCYDESCTGLSNSFLGKLCQAWESEAQMVREDVRLAITRFGVVLSPNGGAYPKMILPFRLGVAISYGVKENKFSWIDIRDLVQVFNLIVTNEQMQGVYNLTALNPITQSHFAELLANHYGTIASLNISTWVLQLILGDSHQIMTENCCILPTRLQSLGYQFVSPDFESYLQQLPDRA